MSTNVVKWSRSLSNRVYIIVRRYVDHARYAVFMAVRFITFFIHFLFYFISLYKQLYIVHASV